jgi:hypothetical protein
MLASRLVVADVAERGIGPIALRFGVPHPLPKGPRPRSSAPSPAGLGPASGHRPAPDGLGVIGL